jgi:hypothetical protein
MPLFQASHLITCFREDGNRIANGFSLSRKASAKPNTREIWTGFNPGYHQPWRKF